MADLTEEVGNSFLNYTDENNPAVILSDYLQGRFDSADIDWQHLSILNEYLSEVVEDTQIYFDGEPILTINE